MRVILLIPSDVEPTESAEFGMQTTFGISQPVSSVIDSTSPNLPPGFQIDDTYPAVPLPGSTPRAESDFTMGIGDDQVDTEDLSDAYIVRGELDPKELTDAVKKLRLPDGQQALFLDPDIEALPVCGHDPAVGSAADVAQKLKMGKLHADGYDGRGVAVAVVDVGINLAHLRQQGQNPRLDPHLSWSLQPSIAPGQSPVGHGSMCAYNIGLIAPQAVLLDHSVLRSRRPGGSQMDGLLSDAILSYSELRKLMQLGDDERNYQSLVISNSWGVYHESMDFPAGDPLRYIDNASHPFNRIVGQLAGFGADIVFAAGNCGIDCPDPKCQGVTAGTIRGANSHPDVLSVGGVDIHDDLVGYSSRGPGQLDPDKPDIAAYTHFCGSECFGKGSPDKGTSTACPIAAGALAAFRSRFPFENVNPNRAPAKLRKVLVDRAIKPPGQTAWDSGFGYGILNATPLTSAERNTLT